MAYADQHQKERSAAATKRWRERLRLEKRARLELERSNRPQIPVSELAWAAGHFEGEGTCTIVRAGGHRTRSLVSLCTTDRETIDFFDARWSSTAIQTKPAEERIKERYTWSLTGERMRTFLIDLQPYLVTTKRKKLFALVLELHELRRQGSHDPGYDQMVNTYREQAAELNRRGPYAMLSPPRR